LRIPPEELVEGRDYVRIGEVERLVGVVALEQERAERRLPIARRPDVAEAAERARLALNEEFRLASGFAAFLAVADRRVPPVPFQIGGWVDVEDGGATKSVLSATTLYFADEIPAMPAVANTYESVSKTRTVSPSYSFGGTFVITKSPSLSVFAV
jgi:hypothetical protein